MRSLGAELEEKDADEVYVMYANHEEVRTYFFPFTLSLVRYFLHLRLLQSSCSLPSYRPARIQ